MTGRMYRLLFAVVPESEGKLDFSRGKNHSNIKH
jgi:hypothetical protein